MPSASQERIKWKIGVREVVFIIYIAKMHPGLSHDDMITRLCTRFPEAVDKIPLATPRELANIRENAKKPFFNQQARWSDETGKLGYVTGLGARGMSVGDIIKQIDEKYPKHRWFDGYDKSSSVEFALELWGVCETRFRRYYRCTDLIPGQVLGGWRKGMTECNSVIVRGLAASFGKDAVLFILTKWDPDFYKLYIPGQDLDFMLARARMMDMDRMLGPDKDVWMKYEK